MINEPQTSKKNENIESPYSTRKCLAQLKYESRILNVKNEEILIETASNWAIFTQYIPQNTNTELKIPKENRKSIELINVKSVQSIDLNFSICRCRLIQAPFKSGRRALLFVFNIFFFLGCFFGVSSLLLHAYVFAADFRLSTRKKSGRWKW